MASRPGRARLSPRLQPHRGEGRARHAGSSALRSCRPGHIEVDARFYSVPYRLLREPVDVRVAARTIEIFHKGRRVAAHARGAAVRAHVTVDDHMPSQHRSFKDWTHSRVIKEAARVGTHASLLVETIMRSRRHPEQGFRSCVGILRLAKTYSPERLEDACERALEIGAHPRLQPHRGEGRARHAGPSKLRSCRPGHSYSSVHSLLKNGLDRVARRQDHPDHVNPDHGNVRGPDYFH